MGTVLAYMFSTHRKFNKKCFNDRRPFRNEDFVLLLFLLSSSFLCVFVLYNIELNPLCRALGVQEQFYGRLFRVPGIDCC